MRFLFAVFLIADLAVGVSCRHPASTGISVDPAFRRWIPPETRVLAGADLEKLKSAPFYRRHQSSLDFPLLDASSERIGVDPRRDISEALIAWSANRPVFLIRGRFTPASVERKLEALGARRAAYKQYTLLGDPANSLVFLKRGVAAAGPTPALDAMLDLDAERGGQVPEELGARLRELPKGDQIWAVSRGGLPFTNWTMRSDYESALSNIVGYVRGTSMGAQVDTGVHFSADLTCASAQGAQRVHDALRAAVAMGRLTTKDNQQDLLRMYDAIRVDRDNDIVRVRADFPGDLADKLAGYLPELRNFAPGTWKPER